MSKGKDESSSTSRADVPEVVATESVDPHDASSVSGNRGSSFFRRPWKERTRWDKLAFCGVIFLGLLLLAEGVSRVVFWNMYGPYGGSLAVQGSTRFAPDPDVVFIYRPGYISIESGFQYNEYGMRVPLGEYTMPVKGENEFRVFLFGGSAMAGSGASLMGEWMELSGVSEHSPATAIDGRLQEILQAAMPGKDVRVYNAAVPKHRLYNSHANYKRLRHLKPDWVISLDGVNESRDIGPDSNERDAAIELWESQPQNKGVFAVTQSVMSVSALAYFLGRWLTLEMGLFHAPIDTHQDQERVAHWENRFKELPPIKAKQEKAVEAAIEQTLASLDRFQRTLDSDGVEHLLLVQPHLSLRNPARLAPVERALYAYMSDDASGGAFSVEPYMYFLHEGLSSSSYAFRNIYPVRLANEWAGWVYSDVCHFTEEGSRLMARAMADHILSEGRNSPFAVAETKP